MQQDNRIELDKVSIVRGILRQWWVIILLTIGVYMLAYVYVDSQYVPQYRTSTTFIVNQKGLISSSYTNITNTKNAAIKFTQILNSNVLKKKVAQELNIPYVNAKVDAKAIPETNLIVLSVTSSSAFQSFQILQSMMENHGLVSEYLLTDITMNTIQPPTVPMGVINPANSTKDAFMISAVAFVLLLVFFGSISLLRDTVKSGSELKKKLDAKLIGTINYEYKHKTLKSFLQKQFVGMLINNPVLSYRYVESYQLVAARIRNRMKRGNHKVLLVTSVMENEGKSTVAANIAYSIASSGSKVLLIDCDMRKPAQYKIFGCQKENAKSLGNVLSGKTDSEDLYVKLAENGLVGILNLEYQKSSTELMENGILLGIIEKAREQFDFIIIDSSPMALVADAEAISKYADASMLVVKQDFVLTKDLNDTIDILNVQKASFIGCVLNGVRQSIFITKSEYDSYHSKEVRHSYRNNALEEKE